MGLLDTAEAKLRGLLGYIEANTPRSTRPVAKPSTVINEGLLNPNKYNAVAANRFKDAALGLGGIIPGAGDYASGVQAADLFNRGENFAGGVAALGALPIIPAIGGMFIGKGAKTWDAIKAQQAEEMLAKGVDPREVWKQTGTMRGVDKALRQEIPDNAAAFRKNATKDLATYGARKEGSIFKHGDLYDAYPDTADIIALRDRGNDYSGYYTEQSNNIGLTFPNKKPDMESLKSLNVHELQHAIQQREGWARGGSPEGMRQILGNGEMTGLYSPEELHEGYRRLAGEAEARLTQSRMGLDAAQRLEHYPYDAGPYGFDVPAEQQIVRGLLDGPAMSYADEAAQKGNAGLLGVGDNAGMVDDYGMTHRPPMRDSGAPLHDLTGGGTVYPDDIYSPNAAMYYGHYGNNDPMDRETIAIIQQMRGNPDAMVDIYRAVPSTLTNEGKIAKLEKQMAAYLKRNKLPEGVTDKNWYDKAYDELAALKAAPPTQSEKLPKINKGDWVTINKKYAKEHGVSQLNGEYKIIKQKVRAKDIYTNGDSIHEFGYDPQ